MDAFQKLLDIARRKSSIDEIHLWSAGSQTYISEIRKEIEEVIEELPKNRPCYLEDELGDVLWDYLNIILCLQKEAGVTIEGILSRACKKYDERISGIENGKLWNDIKSKQKEDLAFEQEKQNRT